MYLYRLIQRCVCTDLFRDKATWDRHQQREVVRFLHKQSFLCQANDDCLTLDWKGQRIIISSEQHTTNLNTCIGFPYLPHHYGQMDWGSGQEHVLQDYLKYHRPGKKYRANEVTLNHELYGSKGEFQTKVRNNIGGANDVWFVPPC